MTISAQSPLRHYELERSERDRMSAEIAKRRRLATMRERYGAEGTSGKTPAIKMSIGPWFVDPLDGCRTRFITAKAEI